MVYVDRPVFYFGDPEFGFVPPPPPPVYFLGPPPDDFVVLAPPILAIGAVGLFLLPRPAFVPFPAFVRPPAYVRAPPGNIIFNNIHNTTVIKTVINNPRAIARRHRGGRWTRRHARAGSAELDRAARLADPAGQAAGAAERRDQSARRPV